MARLLSDLKHGFGFSLGGAGTYAADSVLVDEYAFAAWDIICVRSTGARSGASIMATHNGTNNADATTGNYIETGRVYTSKTDNNTIWFEVVLVGSGISQVMELRVGLSAAWSRGWCFRHPLVGSGILL